jgi:hypothetical protein
MQTHKKNYVKESQKICIEYFNSEIFDVTSYSIENIVKSAVEIASTSQKRRHIGHPVNKFVDRMVSSSQEILH